MHYINKDLIKNFMKENNLSKSKFCKLCDISVSTFDKFFSGKEFNLRIKTIMKLIYVLNTNFYVLFGF